MVQQVLMLAGITHLPHTAVEKRMMIIPHTPFIMLPSSLHWGLYTEVQLFNEQRVSVARLGALPPNPYVCLFVCFCLIYLFMVVFFFIIASQKKLNQ